MNRRAFLARSAAALTVGSLTAGAGCLTSRGGPETGSDSPSGSATIDERSPSESDSPPLSLTNDAYAGGFTTGGAWSVPGFDANRRSFNPDTNPPDGDVGAAWLRTPVDAQRTFRTTPPVTDDSHVYVGSGAGKDPDDDQRAGFVASFEGETGDRAWRTTVTDGGVFGVSVTADSVLAVSGSYEPPNATLTALSPADGSVQWQAELPVGPSGAPLVVDDRVFVVSQDAGLTAIALDGTHQWTQSPVEGEEYVSTRPCATDSTVFVGTDRGRLAALSTDDGQTRWLAKVVDGGHRPRIQTIPTVADDTVFVSGTDYHLYAVDATEGIVRWQQRLLEKSYGNAIPSVTVVDDTVYVNTIHGGLIAYEVADGTERWRTGKYGSSLPLAGAGELLVAPTNGGSVTAYDSSGTRHWKFEMPAFDAPGMAAYIMNPQVALAHDRVYVSLNDGRVFSLGARE